jgi:hypothetical protein
VHWCHGLGVHLSHGARVSAQVGVSSILARPAKPGCIGPRHPVQSAAATRAVAEVVLTATTTEGQSRKALPNFTRRVMQQ